LGSGLDGLLPKRRLKKEKPKGEETVSWKPEVIEVPPPPISKELKRSWSHFIRKVYETDPLLCPKRALALPLRRSTPRLPSALMVSIEVC